MRRQGRAAGQVQKKLAKLTEIPAEAHGAIESELEKRASLKNGAEFYGFVITELHWWCRLVSLRRTGKVFGAVPTILGRRCHPV